MYEVFIAVVRRSTDELGYVCTSRRTVFIEIPLSFKFIRLIAILTVYLDMLSALPWRLYGVVLYLINSLSYSCNNRNTLNFANVFCFSSRTTLSFANVCVCFKINHVNCFKFFMLQSSS